MKNFYQTPKQRRIVMANNKAAFSLSRKPGRVYAEKSSHVYLVLMAKIHSFNRFINWF